MTSVDPATDHLAAGLTELGHRIEEASAAVGHRVRWAWPEVLEERARARGLAPAGRVTASGAGRLVRSADHWVAVQLPRPDDLSVLPAWFALSDPGLTGSVEPDPADPWPAIEAVVGRSRADALVAAGALVGLAVARLGEQAASVDRGVRVHERRSHRSRRRPRVVDLSSLWAGPLCGAVLAHAGAEVVKVESTTRPDGARIGDPVLFDRLNHAKSTVTVDPTTSTGRAALAAWVRDADVVVESTRPRALEQLGIEAAAELRRRDGPGIWISITGHGRGSPRIAFGDDAAVAGGLVDHLDIGPVFRGDALADPLSGLASAATALELLAAGQGGLVEVTMAGVAAAHAEPDRPW